MLFILPFHSFYSFFCHIILCILLFDLFGIHYMMLNADFLMTTMPGTDS